MFWILNKNLRISYTRNAYMSNAFLLFFLFLLLPQNLPVLPTPFLMTFLIHYNYKHDTYMYIQLISEFAVIHMYMFNPGGSSSFCWLQFSCPYVNDSVINTSLCFHNFNAFLTENNVLSQYMQFKSTWEVCLKMYTSPSNSAK